MHFAPAYCFVTMGQARDRGAGERAHEARTALFIGPMTARERAVAAVLQMRGFEITAVADVRHGFDAGRNRRIDLVVIGYVVAATPALPDLIASIRVALRCTVICVGPHATPEQIADIAVDEMPERGQPRGRRRPRTL